MTGEMPVAGTASTGLPEDHAPAQPLSLLRVLDQEFNELHAGDIGAPEIIPELEKIAPVTAIRGNVDTQAWARKFAETEVVELCGVFLYVIHDANAIDLNPKAAGFAAVISGHSHKPSQQVRDGVLYFNPGSAGPRRFKLPISVGRLVIADGKVSAEILEI